MALHHPSMPETEAWTPTARHWACLLLETKPPFLLGNLVFFFIIFFVVLFLFGFFFFFFFFSFHDPRWLRYRVGRALLLTTMAFLLVIFGSSATSLW